MAERIARHRAARGAAWTTIEEPVALAAVLAREARPGRFVLVDCITLWISNLMALRRPVSEEVEGLCRSIAGASCDVCLVSNEVGLGIVPDNPLARQFRDEAGLAHQRLAAVCQHVVFMVAGLPIAVKLGLESECGGERGQGPEEGDHLRKKPEGAAGVLAGLVGPRGFAARGSHA